MARTKNADPKISQDGREALIAFRKEQLAHRPEKTREGDLPKLKNVRNAIKRLQDAIAKLPASPLMLDVARLPFTPDGRDTLRVTGTHVLPDGTTRIECRFDPPEQIAEGIWERILQGDYDPVRTELEILKQALERASAGLNCAIVRKGKPGPIRQLDVRNFLLECHAQFGREGQGMPPARVLGNLAKEINEAVSGEHGGNWKREAEDYMALVHAEINRRANLIISVESPKK